MLQPKDTDWLNGYKKQDPYICCVQETHFRPQDTYRLKVRRWKNIFHANRKKKKAGVIVGTLTPHSHQWTDHQNRKLISKHKS